MENGLIEKVLMDEHVIILTYTVDGNEDKGEIRYPVVRTDLGTFARPSTGIYTNKNINQISHSKPTSSEAFVIIRY